MFWQWFRQLKQPELLGGVYMRKLAPARVSYRDDFLISYRVYMMTGSFHISLFEGTLHVVKIHVWFKIANIMHELLVPVYRQTDFQPERVDVSRLHDTVAKSRCGVKFSPRYDNSQLCGGNMYTNVQPWEGTGVNSPWRESRPGVHVNTPLETFLLQLKY